MLDDIKTRFSELEELTLGFTPGQKDRYLMLWVPNLKKMTGQIRKTAAKDALKQLPEEGLCSTYKGGHRRSTSLELRLEKEREGKKERNILY